MTRDSGFSLIEVVLSLALTLVLAGGVFALLDPAHAAFATAPEAAGMQQRLRVASDTLFSNLMMAGAGPSSGKHAGGLQALFAPVLPYRRGAVGNAPAGSFTTDSVTIVFVPPPAAQATTNVPVSAASPALRVNAESGCRRNPDGVPKPLCGFEPGTSVLIVDDAGRHDVFTIIAIDGDVAQLAVNRLSAEADTIYPAGSTVVEVVNRTYALRVDAAKKVSQLVTYDGSDRADVPVVDDVVAIAFEYFGEALPPVLTKSLDDPIGPWTSYGPRPPPAGVRSTAYPEGENCTFARDSGGQPVPRLMPLAEGSDPYALVKLTASQLTDGPWCPDAVSPDRFDADLLRIRAIAVTLRLQSALEVLRGPAGALFANAGPAKDSRRWVPDQETRFMVTPRNLNLRR